MLQPSTGQRRSSYSPRRPDGMLFRDKERGFNSKLKAINLDKRVLQGFPEMYFGNFYNFFLQKLSFQKALLLKTQILHAL